MRPTEIAWRRPLLAAFALAAATPALAETGVTAYGLVDLGGQVLDGHSRLARVVSGGNTASRLGFKGTEELGGGFAADFTLEGGVNVDEGGSSLGGALFGRQAFLAMRSPYGTLGAGRQYGSLFVITNDFSEFYNGLSGASTASIGGFAGGYEPVRGAAPTAKLPAAGSSTNGGPSRINNSLRYSTPVFGGLKASVACGAGEVTGGTRQTRLVDLSIRYTAGALDAMLSHVDDRAAGATSVATTTLAASIAVADNLHVEGGALFLDDRRPANLDGNGFWLGADYRFGVDEVRLQGVRNRPLRTTAGRSHAGAATYLHDFSKRTTLYASFGLFTSEGTGAPRYNQALPDGLWAPGDRHPKLAEYTLGIRQRF